MNLHFNSKMKTISVLIILAFVQDTFCELLPTGTSKVPKATLAPSGDLKPEIGHLSNQLNKLILQIADSTKQSTMVEQIQNKMEQLQIKLEQQNSKIEQQNSKIEQQNIRIEQQNGKIEQQNGKIEQQNIRIEKQELQLYQMESVVSKLNACEEKSGNFTQQHISTTARSTESVIGGETVFTIWGRKHCPANISEEVYSGVTGGSRFNHTGGGANYLCVSLDPIWDDYKYFGFPNYHVPVEWGYLYGSEYQRVEHNLLEYTAPCAVCRTNSGYSTSIMITGRNKCYQGWTKAYHGHLITGTFDEKKASEYICLSQSPEKIGDYVNQNPKLIYYVRSQCGSLPCPPYEDNTIVTCVVCLK